jgi:parallel beta-helix repeat protein
MMKNMKRLKKYTALALIVVLLASFGIAAPVAAAGTTSVTITKYDAHGGVISTMAVTWEQMRDQYMGLPVYGDGTTHYYCEGPNFDESRTFDTLWDPLEIGNIDSRDYGAAKGTDVKDLCNLAGGAGPGYTIKTTAIDGWSKVWDYNTIYTPDERFGKIVLTWYTSNGEETGSGYVPDDYDTGMRLLFFTDIADIYGRHVAGNYDVHESLPENLWYYYFDGQWWPTTSGMSGKYISKIDIYPPKMISCDAAGNAKENFYPGEIVYVKGQGLTASRNYNLWTQTEPAVYAASAKGDTVPGATPPAPLNTAIDPSGAQEAVTTDASGDFSPTAIWTIPATPTPQKYDIIADNQGAGTVGTFDNNDGADSFGFEGFTVVLQPPTAAFTSDVQTGLAPLTVNFTDQSTGDPTEWVWDFNNDGNPDSYVQNPAYTYNDAGTYTIKLTATNAGGSDDEVKTDYINATVPGPKTWYVDDSGGADFTTIQAAVNAAAAGDTIIVRDGTYAENVVVSKSLVIQSENGAAATSVTAVTTSSPVFTVNSDQVSIVCFTVSGTTSTSVGGIEVKNVNSCVIADNDVTGCGVGIRLAGTATGNTVTGNNCHGNTKYGFAIRDSAYGNSLSGNTFSANTQKDICIKDMSHDNTLWLNDVLSTGVDIATSVVSHSPEQITYTYNSGTYTGYLGNRYASYAGTDADGNGVGDTAFTASSYTDSYPLMAQAANYVEIVLPPAPTAAFTSDVQTGGAPLMVHFTDQSTNDPTAWAWDLDGDGEAETFVQNPIYTYNNAGTYTITLTATNAGGSDDEAKANYITVTSAPTHPAWDLNNDHTCNIGDVVKIGLQWGLTGTPGWIPEDLNNDGAINIGDVVVLGLHWGEAW